MAKQVWLPLLLTVLIIVGVSRPILSLAAFAIMAVYIFMAPMDASFAMLFYLLPFACIFKTSPMSASLLTYLELIVAAKQIVVGKRLNATFLASLVVFVLYIAIGFNWQLTTLIKQAAIPLLLYCYFSQRRIDFKRITVYYAWGLLISSVLARFMDNIPNLSSYVAYDRAYDIAGTVYRFAGMYSDPNYYSTALIVTMAGMLLMITRGQMSVWYYLMVLAFIVFGALTVSKSFILLLVLLAVVYVMMQIQRKKYGVAFVALLLVGVVAFMVLSGAIDIFENTLSRLMGGDLTTNRNNIWARYLSEFAADPLKVIIGHGIGSTSAGVAAHNTYIDFLYYYGVCGTLLFIFVCVSACKSKRRRKASVISYVPAFLLLVSAGFLSMLMYYDFAFNLLYVICALKSDIGERHPRVRPVGSC